MATDNVSAGRRPGAAASLREPTTLGIHHFAFLRAAMVGLDLRAAFARYLAWSETSSNLEYIQRRRDVLFDVVLQAARRLDATRDLNAKLTRELRDLGVYASDTCTFALPRLTGGISPDAFAELDAMAEYPVAQSTGVLGDSDEVSDAWDEGRVRRDMVLARVEALNRLQPLLVTKPRACDHLEKWFSGSVVARLRQVGVQTVADLVSLINAYGHRWHERVQGVGPQRASWVVAWLRSQQETLELEIHVSAQRDLVDDLRLQFEAVSHLPAEEQVVVRDVLEGLIRAYHARRWDESRPAVVSAKKQANLNPKFAPLKDSMSTSPVAPTE